MESFNKISCFLVNATSRHQTSSQMSPEYIRLKA